ncbi:MAG: chemotaxis protein CheW [Polyangiales bacterium]
MRATTTWVGLEVGGVSYALNIQHVREIIRPLPMQLLPHSSEMVIGVIDHRGDVVPILDLRVRFGATSRPDLGHTRWVIAHRDGRLFGLVVDRVTEVFGSSEMDSRPVPELGQGGERRGIIGAYSRAGRLVFALDIARITDMNDGPLSPAGLALGLEGT